MRAVTQIITTLSHERTFILLDATTYPCVPTPVRLCAVSQGADGNPGDEEHRCTSWCAEQLAASQLELAELRDQVAALRRDGRVGIEATSRTTVNSKPAAQLTDSGEDAVGARDRSPGTRSGSPLLPRPSAAKAAARSAESAASPSPSGFREDPHETRGERAKRALLQIVPSIATGTLWCNKTEIGDLVAAGADERPAVVTKLFSSNPGCAVCVASCRDVPGFDANVCANGCHHQKENSCNGNETGWERARPLLHQVDLQNRTSLVRLMAEVRRSNCDIAMRLRGLLTMS